MFVCPSVNINNNCLPLQRVMVFSQLILQSVFKGTNKKPYTHDVKNDV